MTLHLEVVLCTLRAFKLCVGNSKSFGEVSEWPKEHAWKVCISQGIEGSTPSLTAISRNS